MDRRLSIGSVLFVSCCMFFMAGTIDAQDIKRNWALSYKASPWMKPILTDNPSNKSIKRGFSAFSVMGEYYLPKKITAEAGYFRAEVNYGVRTRTMEGFQLGGKKYFVNPDFFLQPYVMAAAQFNWNERYEDSKNYEEYYNSLYMKNPRLSFVPGVGSDIYLLSPIALTVRYNLNIGIDSKTIIDTKSAHYDNAYLLKDRGMYHNFEVGVKITFPFRFTEDFTERDRDMLFDAIFELFR